MDQIFLKIDKNRFRRLHQFMNKLGIDTSLEDMPSE